ncbi:hypothetical protein [uncultured Methylobacterium sp.]|uniref:hypothetical protein n=1 Tax=uncultured Methylobacterium sp. TaxID=157278 RepID=UPI0025947ADB|nr:hypothetical protein [uncultured Methylobacterium sp.]
MQIRIDDPGRSVLRNPESSRDMPLEIPMADASDDAGLKHPPLPIMERRIRRRRSGDPIFRTIPVLPQVARRAGLSLEIPARNREEPERPHTATYLEILRHRMVGQGSDGDPAGQQEHDEDDEQDAAATEEQDEQDENDQEGHGREVSYGQTG